MVSRRCHLATTKSKITVVDRQTTHGPFVECARLSQALKETMRTQSGWARLDDDMKESLEMQVHKVARILTGDPHYIDHWADIAGYALRVNERLVAK
jgi:2,3-bisphosphoglycerate-independent phosphoglycerate mutase